MSKGPDLPSKGQAHLPLEHCVRYCPAKRWSLLNCSEKPPFCPTVASVYLEMASETVERAGPPGTLAGGRRRPRPRILDSCGALLEGERGRSHQISFRGSGTWGTCSLRVGLSFSPPSSSSAHCLLYSWALGLSVQHRLAAHPFGAKLVCLKMIHFPENHLCWVVVRSCFTASSIQLCNPWLSTRHKPWLYAGIRCYGAQGSSLP